MDLAYETSFFHGFYSKQRRLTSLAGARLVSRFVFGWSHPQTRRTGRRNGFSVRRAVAAYLYGQTGDGASMSRMWSDQVLGRGDAWRVGAQPKLSPTRVADDDFCRGSGYASWTLAGPARRTGRARALGPPFGLEPSADQHPFTDKLAGDHGSDFRRFFIKKEPRMTRGSS